MIVNQKLIQRSINRLKIEMGIEALARKYGYEQPLRSEIFSSAQMERHAVSLARWHEVGLNPKPR